MELKFTVTIKGQRFDFETFTDALECYNNFYKQGHWESTLRAEDKNNVYIYNYKTNSFFIRRKGK